MTGCKFDYTITVPQGYQFLSLHSKPKPNESKTVNVLDSIAYRVIENADSVYVPAFNLYHRVKRDAFLNTENKHGNILESSANFILSPVRYLFNGKSITQIDSNGHCQMQQTFDYEKDNLAIEVLKTSFAIACLPLSLPVGGVLKAISLLSPNTCEKQRSIVEELHSHRVDSNEALYRQKGIHSLFSDQTVEHQNYPFPAPNQNQLVQMQAVADVANLLDESNIPHWLDCGTLLGARRHGSMIPWDTDVDMGILADDHHNVMRALSKLDPQKYIVQDWSSALCPQMFIRVLIKETNSYLDIYHHVINPEDQTICYKYSWTKSPWVLDSVKKREIIQEHPIKIADVFPLKKAQFGHTNARVPANWEAFLQVKYGQNLDPCKVWNNATGQYEKVVGHPYWEHSDF
jgi:hypothetical protein